MLRRTWWKLALCAILTGLLAIGALAEPALTDETSQPADEQAVADALAEALYARASAEEPAVTADMQSMETEYAHLVGLDFRLKSRESISRKILLEMHTLEITPEAAAEAITDALRYTFCIDEDRYVETVDGILRWLDAKDYTIERVKNTWSSALYKGINCKLRLADGMTVEVQFHTPESYDAKESKTHAYYEILRSEDSTDEEKQMAAEKQAEVFGQVTVPEGAPEYAWN